MQQTRQGKAPADTTLFPDGQKYAAVSFPPFKFKVYSFLFQGFELSRFHVDLGIRMLREVWDKMLKSKPGISWQCSTYNLNIIISYLKQMVRAYIWRLNQTEHVYDKKGWIFKGKCDMFIIWQLNKNSQGAVAWEDNDLIIGRNLTSFVEWPHVTGNEIHDWFILLNLT